MPYVYKEGQETECPYNCGGTEFQVNVSAWAVYTRNKDELNYVKTVVTDERAGDDIICATCHRELPNDYALNPSDKLVVG